MEPLEGQRPKKPRIIFVEGIEDVGIFTAICREENLTDVIQLIPYAELGKLGRFLVDVFVKDPDFKIVQRVGLTKDADKNPGGADQSLRDAWRRAQEALNQTQTPIPVCLHFTVPDNENNGRIENLCLQSPTFPEILKCAEDMFTCASALADYTIDHEKSVAAAYLSMMKKSGLRLGLGAEAGCWNLQSAAFRPLRAFIRAIGA